MQLETWKTFRVTGEKIQEIPLRHERDELATCRELGEISDRHDLPINDTAQFSNFLMRLFQEFIEQPKLVHQLQRGGMNGVAAEIAIEISMRFQDSHIHAGACEQVTGHHTRRPAAYDYATRLQFFNHGCHG